MKNSKRSFRNTFLVAVKLDETMHWSPKLKIFGGILTFVGLVCMTISFVSPGWVIINVQGTSYNDNSVKGTVETYSGGLWYFSVCYQYILSPNFMVEPLKSMYPAPKNVCEVATYSYKATPETLKELFLIVNKIWMLEIRIMSSVGVFCAVLGFIETIVFIRHMAKFRCTGILACITLSISGGTYLAAVVKTATATLFNREMISIVKKYTYDWLMDDDMEFACPWGLVLGGIGSLFILISAIGHLCILSRNTTANDLRENHAYIETNKGVATQHSFRTIVPPQYHEFVEIKVPQTM